MYPNGKTKSQKFTIKDFQPQVVVYNHVLNCIPSTK